MHRHASLGLAVAIMLASGYGVFAATAWPWKAALFPLAIGIPLFCLAATEALWVLFGSTEKAQTQDTQVTLDAGAGRRILVAGVWMLAFFAGIMLLGFPIAVPLFLFLYLKLQGGEGWVLSGVVTLVVTGVFYGLFDALLHLPFPPGWLLAWLGLA